MIERSRWLNTRNLIRKIREVFSPHLSEILLNELLGQKLQDAPLAEKMHWFSQVLSWLFEEADDEKSQTEVRFRYFFKILEKNPEWRNHFREIFRDLLAECQFLSFFTNIGVAVEHGLWGDIEKRIIRKFIPSSGSKEFQEVLLSAFLSHESGLSDIGLSDEVLLQLDSLLFSGLESCWLRVAAQSQDALVFLSAHAAHYGISSEIIDRLGGLDELSRSSFIRLAQSVHQGELPVILPLIDESERDLDAVYAHIEEGGVSVDVVNRLETISALLARLRLILDLRSSHERIEELRRIQKLVVQSIVAGVHGRSVLGYIRRHFYLLSRKIVERNGHSGEHYIARSAGEFGSLFRSAIGGGLIVVLMTVLKTWLIRSEPAPIFLATGIWIIYSAGFLSMQFLGCTLATKIPSFTASRLAGFLKNIHRNKLDHFKDEFRLTFKSQGIALLGNLVGVIPFALLLSLIFKMDDHYAHHLIHDLNPVFSFAVTLGALTGLQLWLSSIAGGWFENWVVFNRIPTAIENHYRMRKVFGEKVAQKLAHWVLHESSGVATNMALGFLFGFVPLLGTLFGLNWNGNHVTISTAGATFAVASIGFSLEPWQWVGVVSGLLLIALMNFGVSFTLALFVAGNAQHMKFRRVLKYLKASL